MKEWSQHNFKKGLNLNSEMLDVNQFLEATNVVIDNGAINTREGYTSPEPTGYVNTSGIHGLFEYRDNTAATTKMIYAKGTNLATGVTTLDSDINAANNINFSKFQNNEKLYYVDGEHELKSLYENNKVDYGNGTNSGLSTSAYIYVSGGITYAVTTSVSRKIERWKLTGSTWAWDKDISGVLGIGESYGNFCWDGTYYYGVRSDTLVMEKWSDTPSLMSSLSITDGIFTFTPNIYNKCVYDTLNQNIILLSYDTLNNYFIKCNTTTGYIEHFLVVTSEPGDIAIFNNILYLKLSTSSSLIYSLTTTGTFSVPSLITLSITGDKLTTSNNNLVVVSHNGADITLRFYDSNLFLNRVKRPTTIITVLERVNSVDSNTNDIYIYGRNAIGTLINWRFAYTLTAYNPHIYSSYTFYDIPVQVTFSASASGIFRAGNWYFAYSIGNYNTQSGLFDYSKLSTPVLVNAAATSDATLLISNILTTNSIIKWYARHETESYFYEIGVSTTVSYAPTSLVTQNIYDERDIYSPPPVGCKQLLSYRDMMVYVKGENLYFSNYFDPLNVPDASVITTDSGMGGIYPVGADNIDLTAIYQLHGYLFAFKQNSAYRISGDPGDLTSFRIDCLSETIGVKNELCITDDGNVMYILTDTGIYILNENGLVKQPISEDIKPIFTSTLYNKNVKLCYHKKLERLLLLVPPE